MAIRSRRSGAFIAGAVICLLAAGAAAWLALAPRRPNLLFIVIDTLGADHVGAYTPGLDTTPNIDRLAAGGARFEMAYSAAPWTKPSFASMFTGQMPGKHGLIGLHDLLSDRSLTLAEILKERGMRTGGIVSHTFIDGKSGIGQGFQSYGVVKFKGNVHDAVTSKIVTDDAIRWLESHGKAQEGFFLFVHYFDPHYNYQHHPEFDRSSGYQGRLKPGIDIRKLRKMIPKFEPGDIRYLVDLYHEEIAYTDSQIGRLLEHMRSAGLSDDTIVVLTADHGEEFLEHGYIGHTITLYDELIRIPFIIVWPGRLEPRVVDWPVSLVDLMPTLLDLMGVDAPAQFDGLSLKGCLEGACPAEPRELFAEVDFKSSHIGAKKSAVMSGLEKLIEDLPTGRLELYDRETDPGELKDLSAAHPPSLPKLREALSGYQKGRKPPPPESRKPKGRKEIENLKTLGYL